MSIKDKATDAPSVGPERAPGVSRELLDVDEVCEIVGLSRRSIYRLADRGAMPRGLRLGGSRRWRRAEVLAWIAGGCPRVDERGRA